MITNIFEIPVYKKYLQLDNTSIASYCYSIKEQDAGRVVSNIGGYQSNNLTGEHPPLNTLFNCIEEQANEFTQKLNLSKVVLDNIWININGYKDFNLPHTHLNTMISGVYYVLNNEHGGNIFFNHPAGKDIGMVWENRKNTNNTYNSGKYWLPATPGTLYLFPSWLEHYVEPNMSKDKERVSISFNCV